MSLLQERMKREQAKREEAKKAKSGNNFQKMDIWFKWTKNEHTIRLAGDFIVVNSHWIGPSAFNAVKLYDEKFFVGEDKLPYQINCNNWDVETETEDKKGECVICKLRKIAGDILYSEEGKALDEKDKKFFKDLKYKCDSRKRYFFNCIDRDDPYIDEAKTIKGYKIIEVPYSLMDSILALSEKLSGVDIASEDGGIDLVISKSGGDGSPVKYNVLPKMDGLTVKSTPLDEQEKEMKLNDLKTIFGKKQDPEVLFDKLNEDIKMLLDDSTETSTESDPF